jgi:uncharacterized protein YndB with AHSA1/START domain
MSHCRQQTFIEAPLETVWNLIAEIDNHPQWWPRVVDVQCEGLDEGCTYREVVQSPGGGTEEMKLLIEGREELRNLRIRCLNTGTFVRFSITEAQGGTFVDGEMGMDPQRLVHRAFDAVVGKRYFTSWLRSTLDGLRGAAATRGQPVA